MRASVWDITATPDIAGRDSGDELSEQLASTSLESKRPAPDCFLLPEGVEPGTVDVITVIYVLSALHPKEWEQAIHNLYTVSRLS
jgi:tRNAThr (cytosine32-N3)-methyltransferase